MRAICLGAAAIDRKYHVRSAVAFGTSNPAGAARGFGGVARNVAENLARLGVDVSLVSIVGDDRAGAALLANLRRAGVDVTHVIVAEGLATAEYVAILDRNGALTIGAADMSILDALSSDDISWVRDAGAGWLFADCNVPADVLAFLLAPAKGKRGKLAIDAVSIAKVARLPSDLRGVDLLFINEDEARAFLACPPSLDGNGIAHALLARGAAAIVLMLGARGVVVGEAGATSAFSAPAAIPRDVTGAGDALVAGTLYRLLDEVPVAAAVQTGLLLAGLTIESGSSVRPDLSAALLR